MAAVSTHSVWTVKFRLNFFDRLEIDFRQFFVFLQNRQARYFGMRRVQRGLTTAEFMRRRKGLI